MFPSVVEEEEEEENDQLPTLKVTWKAKKTDETNGGYSEEVLHSVLSQVSSVWIILVDVYTYHLLFSVFLL